MRVVHLLPALEQGGVESVVLNLNRALVRAGCESIVISRGGKLVRTIEADGGVHHRLELKSKNPLTYFSRAWKLRRVLKSIKPDLVCVHSRVPAWLFVWANRGLGLKWISYAHGANSVSRYSAVMTKGDLVVSPSKFLSDYLLDNYGKSDTTLASRLRVIPNCVDLKKFDPSAIDAKTVAKLREEWGVKEGERVVMSVGRITKLKGFDAVMRDFAENPQGKLVIVGGADKDKLELLSSLKTLADELKISDRVVFAGALSCVPECLSIATEVVSGNVTKPESFGLSVIEAYAMGKSVRCLRRFGGTAEVMDAVSASGETDLRTAVSRLYGFDRFAETTLALYRELTRQLTAGGN